jgi:hypothetical protein
MQYKSVCENLTNMFILHHICIHFQKHFPIYVLMEIQVVRSYHKIVILIEIYR